MDGDRLTCVALGSSMSSEIDCGSSFTLGGAFSFPFPLSLFFDVIMPLEAVPSGVASSEMVIKEFVRRGAGRDSPCSTMESEVDASGGDRRTCATLGLRPRAEARCARLLMTLGQGFPVDDETGVIDTDAKREKTCSASIQYEQEKEKNVRLFCTSTLPKPALLFGN
jgi:hypothetical protein